MIDKRQILIDTALDLFYAHGINTIGINEVLKVSGVAKKTLYNHFRSKEDLVLAALEKRDQIFCAWLKDQLQGGDSDQERVQQLFMALTLWFTNKVPALRPFRGCFFINSAAEFGDEASEISHFCKVHKARVRQLIAESLTLEDDQVLDGLCLLKEGAIVSAYVNHDYEAAEKCQRMAQALVSGRVYQ